MKHGIENSACFLLFLSSGVFTRPFCQLEIAEAVRLKKPIILMHEEDERHGKFNFALDASEDGGVPVEFVPIARKLLNDNKSEKYMREQKYAQVMMSELVRVISQAKGAQGVVNSVAKRGIQRDITDMLSVSSLDAALQKWPAKGAFSAIGRAACAGDEVSVRAMLEGIEGGTARAALANSLMSAKLGTTLVIAAATNGHLSVVKELASFGGDISCSDKFGYNAAHKAAERGDLVMLQWLCTQTSGLASAKAKNGKTPSDFASTLALHKRHVETGNHAGCVAFLSEQASMDTGAGENMSEHAPVALQDILARYPTKMSYGKTVVALACYASDCEALRILAEQQPHFDPDAFVEGGVSRKTTAAHCAASVGCVGILELLLENGASSFGNRSVSGRTPAHDAALGGHVQTLDWLSTVAGADLESRDYRGITPLQLATAKGHAPAIALLTGWCPPHLVPHLGDVVCSKGHTMQLLSGIATEQNWACDHKDLPGGCLSGCNDFGQSTGWSRYTCKRCDFDMCGRCADASSKFGE
jgi:hypothetical protein